jgi:hypothetical protein
VSRPQVTIDKGALALFKKDFKDVVLTPRHFVLLKDDDVLQQTGPLKEAIDNVAKAAYETPAYETPAYETMQTPV